MLQFHYHRVHRWCWTTFWSLLDKAWTCFTSTRLISRIIQMPCIWRIKQQPEHGSEMYLDVVLWSRQHLTTWKIFWAKQIVWWFVEGSLGCVCRARWCYSYFKKASCLWQIWNTWAIESLLCWHTTFTNQQQNHNKIEMDEKAEHEHVLSARIQKRWLSLETTNRQMHRISTWDGCSSMFDIRGAMVIGYHARISYNLYTLRPEDQPRLWCLLDSLMIASAWPVERDNINYSDISVWGNKDFMMQQWLFCFGNEGATTFTLMQSARYAR